MERRAGRDHLLRPCQHPDGMERNGGRPAHRGQTTGLYDTEKLSVYDKYAMFLHGNNGLSRVQGNGSGRILVIKDSYANCFVPYLTANYADIDVVDFRNYNYGLIS